MSTVMLELVLDGLIICTKNAICGESEGKIKKILHYRKTLAVSDNYHQTVEKINFDFHGPKGGETNQRRSG